MTTLRRISLLAAVGAFLMALAGCGGGGDAAADVTPPALEAVLAAPALAPNEATVSAEASATDDSGVAEVALVAEGPTTVREELGEAGPGAYEGELDLPRNDGPGEVSYDVWVEATDAAGNVTASEAVTVLLDAPPAPPAGR